MNAALLAPTFPDVVETAGQILASRRYIRRRWISVSGSLHSWKSWQATPALCIFTFTVQGFELSASPGSTLSLNMACCTVQLVNTIVDDTREVLGTSSTGQGCYSGQNSLYFRVSWYGVAQYRGQMFVVSLPTHRAAANSLPICSGTCSGTCQADNNSHCRQACRHAF